MSYEEFVVLVKKMRTAQREYFRGRRESQLRTCKELEKAVDEAIKEFGRGPEMFAEEAEADHGPD